MRKPISPHSRYSLSPRHTRRGSLVVEAVIAVAMLATATLALTRLARSASALSQQGDQQLAATLTAENLIERLRTIPTNQISDQATQIAQNLADSSRCEIAVLTEVFDHEGHSGVHIRVDVASSDANRVTLHDWKLDPTDDSTPATDDATEAGDE